MSCISGCERFFLWSAGDNPMQKNAPELNQCLASVSVCVCMCIYTCVCCLELSL